MSLLFFSHQTNSPEKSVLQLAAAAVEDRGRGWGLTERGASFRSRLNHTYKIWVKQQQKCRNCCVFPKTGPMYQTSPNLFLFVSLSITIFSPCCSLLTCLLCPFSLPLSASVCVSVSPHHLRLCLLSSGIACLIFFLCGEAAGWIRAQTGSTNHPDLRDSFSITSTMPLLPI